ncbi:hypothetical protein JFT87_15145 [Pseudomonas sp. TH15]|nr:hypothetical protein [Pseudomonas sp. TH15]
MSGALAAAAVSTAAVTVTTSTIAATATAIAAAIKSNEITMDDLADIIRSMPD